MTTLFHGSNTKIASFDLDHMGKGHDQYGPGIYMIDDRDEAERYGKFVHQCEVDIGKFVSNKSRPNKNWVKTFIRSHFDRVAWENWDENKQSAMVAVMAAILSEPSMADCLQAIWSEVFSFDRKLACVEFSKSGINGSILHVSSARIYTVYNPGVIDVTTLVG